MPAITATVDRERRDATTDPVGPPWTDPQWVRRAFVELIEANYPPAAARAARAAPPRRSRVTTRTGPVGPGPAGRPRHRGRWRTRPSDGTGPAHRPARQRSPPVRRARDRGCRTDRRTPTAGR
jgi:hypothetical protein